MLYLDTSALAKLYVQEEGSASVQAMVRQNAPLLFTSRITYAEILAFLARCRREGRFSVNEYQRQKRRFFQDWIGLLVIEVTERCLSAAERVIDRYGLRGSDAIHLCSALRLGTPQFACFDHRLNGAAAAEKLVVSP